MFQVRLCFFARRDRELERHVAPAQALDLGENKPHPVTSFSAVAQFPAYVIKDRLLGIHEALEVVGVVHVFF